MANDTQDPAPPSSEATANDQPTQQDTAKPKKKYEAHTQVGKLWEAFGNSDEPANSVAGANNPENSKDFTFAEVKKAINMDTAKTFYKTPCARDSLLTGIGTGFGVGGLRTILGGGIRSLPTAANWAVSSFAIASLGMYEFCKRRRRLELDGMRQAVELMKEVKEKKQKEKEKAAEEAARLAEEEKKRKSWTNLSNYKFW